MNQLHFRANPEPTFRRSMTAAPFLPRRPPSHDSLIFRLSLDVLGGRLCRLPSNTRTLTGPRLISLGAFGSLSTNIYFLGLDALLGFWSKGGVAGRAAGTAARMSSGSSAGSGRLAMVFV